MIRIYEIMTKSKYKKKKMKYYLSRCTNGEVDLFRRMYAPKNLLDINLIVDRMHYTKLDWATTQLENTLVKNKRIG